MSENVRETVLRVCGIEPESIVDGPGFRYVLFLQGCPHRCPGCHNPESWSYDGGYDMTVGEIYDEIKSRHKLRGVTFSGGEPFEQVPALLELAKIVKKDGYTLMAYSGYTLEELRDRKDPETDELLGLLDILVDGRYIEAKRNLTLLYRGSENQRVIDMRKTRSDNEEVVLYRSDFVNKIEI